MNSITTVSTRLYACTMLMAAINFFNIKKYLGYRKFFNIVVEPNPIY